MEILDYASCAYLLASNATCCILLFLERSSQHNLCKMNRVQHCNSPFVSCHQRAVSSNYDLSRACHIRWKHIQKCVGGGVKD